MPSPCAAFTLTFCARRARTASLSARMAASDNRLSSAAAASIRSAVPAKINTAINVPNTRFSFFVRICSPFPALQRQRSGLPLEDSAFGSDRKSSGTVADVVVLDAQFVQDSQQTIGLRSFVCAFQVHVTFNRT